MRQSAKEKIVVLAVSFALFVGGVLAVAVRQTVLKNGKKK